jgi:hypothetical protein
MLRLCCLCLLLFKLISLTVVACRGGRLTEWLPGSMAIELWRPSGGACCEGWLRRGRKGRKRASKDVVDSNTIRGWQALPLVHFLLPRLHVAISLAPAGDEPDGERFYCGSQDYRS